ncbi:outer membrane lipoprotein periplasmic chaperone LolA [Vibrio cholerae]|uniref:outer membrane lipoprotein chaperone LolA n=1 Tax=Vibrio cholerae TaxID=666 RepID=UPI00115AE8D2|nr:outer membrane lipoprotein chaperone LolA [Vibrio cholerae]EGQ7879173.1 outer membrane lipoprotein chaperone LolA [Vibrio cholerae]EGQ9435341.1 outer membrane lipoprotein chaperone LolA [Vibrio cholerae]EGQ9437450.1 outer membrane lipoprotein chaperone LolA [Vibrio cholerae]EGQ9632867.1 outer membrane lipoprotein chaperone LolA [Vibrio cholerae]EGQ9635721.1 outer membrane lipoprotein chaperone LolA [Vibrio cholerae]
MNKWLALLFCSFSAIAAPKDTLSERLAMSEGFSATFNQQVLSPEGKVILAGNGKVDIARPSLFRWETETPDENLLVSDGTTLWHFDPFVEQVTLYRAEEALEQTPFVLLTRNKASDWDAYHVEEKGDVFTLTPTALDSNQGRFQITISEKGVVQGFKVIEQDGQQSEFIFSKVKQQKPNASVFNYKVPKGVEVDDQRN